MKIQLSILLPGDIAKMDSCIISMMRRLTTIIGKCTQNICIEMKIHKAGDLPDDE
jgi:hypothetical protein